LLSIDARQQDRRSHVMSALDAVILVVMIVVMFSVVKRGQIVEAEDKAENNF